MSKASEQRVIRWAMEYYACRKKKCPDYDGLIVTTSQLKAACAAHAKATKQKPKGRK